VCGWVEPPPSKPACYGWWRSRRASCLRGYCCARGSGKRARGIKKAPGLARRLLGWIVRAGGLWVFDSHGRLAHRRLAGHCMCCARDSCRYRSCAGKRKACCALFMLGGQRVGSRRLKTTRALEFDLSPGAERDNTLSTSCSWAPLASQVYTLAPGRTAGQVSWASPLQVAGRT